MGRRSGEAKAFRNLEMKTVVLLSGGIDSVALAEREYQSGRLVGTIFVDMYHPASVPESYAAFQFHARTKVPHKVVHVSGLDLGDMASAKNAGVVPSRNLVLLSIASNVAASLGGDMMLIGATQNDDADYIDCREESLQQASSAFVAMGGLPIHAPFVKKTKAQVIDIAISLGLSEKDAWSCYRKGPMPCGSCASCRDASKAWSSASARLAVETLYGKSTAS